MLKRAVDLAQSDAFRHKRARFYEWQEEIIEEDISTEKAIEELEQRLLEYNKATKNAFGEVLEKYVFTVIPIGLGLAGAVMAGTWSGTSAGRCFRSGGTGSFLEIRPEAGYRQWRP